MKQTCQRLAAWDSYVNASGTLVSRLLAVLLLSLGMADLRAYAGTDGDQIVIIVDISGQAEPLPTAAPVVTWNAEGEAMEQPELGLGGVEEACLLSFTYDLYPNPAVSQIQINLRPSNTWIALTVLDGANEEVFFWDRPAGSTTADLPEGTYTFVMETAEGTATESVVIQ